MACAGRGLSWRRCRDLLSSSAELGPRRRWTVELEEAPSDDRNGTRPAPSADHRRVDRHRDRRDLAPRIAPADRAGVRRFAGRFRGQELEVALEATTGWRFVVEELQAVGAQVHLAEPAETAARRGTKKRAKSDRADARHLRELLMVGRLPESWIPPEHLLDLRARVRLRHTLVDAAPRVAAAHAGGALSPRRPVAQLADRPPIARLAGAARAAGGGARADHDRAGDDRRARRELVPLDQRAARLRAPPARLPGADAPLRDRAADVGHDPRRARRRAPLLAPRARPSATPAWTSPSTNPTPAAPPATSPAKARRRCAGRSSKPPNAPAGPARPTTTTTRRRPHGSAATAPAWPSRASCSSAATTRCANSARRPWRPHDRRSARAALTHADAPRPAPGMLLPPPPGGRPS